MQHFRPTDVTLTASVSEQLTMPVAPRNQRRKRGRSVDRFDGQRLRPPTTSFVMSGEERELLDRLAREHDITLGEVLRRSLRLYATHHGLTVDSEVDAAA